MARKISHTLTLEGALVARTPLHIGGADEGMTSDMPLAVDGLGRYYLPGTSLAGALRAYCGRAEHDPTWGFTAGNDQGSASRMIVEDAPALGAPIAELWHGNGIDRRWGAAADKVKYDREVLPRGTAFAFRLSLEVLHGESVDERRGFLAWLLGALETGQVAFGGGSTRGLGRVRLEKPRCYERDWTSAKGILEWLDEKPATDCQEAWKQQVGLYAPAECPKRLRIEIHWRPKGPLMSKSARDGVVVDGMPFLSRLADGSLALALPGSGIKGAWRSHAERIIRTVIGKELSAASDQHREQVDVPLAADVFGRARPTDPEPRRRAEVGRRKSRLAFETCYANWALSEDEWAELDRSEDPWRNNQRAGPGARRPLTMAMHVAIDRWTGGAAESLLYSAVEPENIEWAPLVLHFDAADAPFAEFALLWLTVRDFCTGRIPIGFGVNRGYGDLEVKQIKFFGLDALWDGADEQVLAVSDTVIDTGPIAGLLEHAKGAWQKWVEQQQKEVK